jgi:hypothetical protein
MRLGAPARRLAARGGLPAADSGDQQRFGRDRVMAKTNRSGSELRRLVLAALGVALALVAAAAPLRAAPGDPIGSEFQVNSYTTNSQYKRFGQGVSALAGGGFVVAWDSNGQDCSSRGVFGQRYDSAGAALGTEFQVNSYTMVKGKGANLTLPALPLNPAAGVTVQLVKDPGSGPQCWQADFAAPATTDTATQFKDKTP